MKVIKAILRVGTAHFLVQRGLTPDVIAEFNPELAAILRAIMRYEEQYSRVPSEEWLKEKFPNIEFPDVTEEEIMPIVDSLVDQSKLALIKRAMKNANQILQKYGSDRAIEQLSSELAEIKKTFQLCREVYVEDSLCTVLAEYESIVKNRGILGVPWPWSVLNDHTNGIMPGKYYVIWGIQKSLKTWLGLYLVNHIYENTDVPILLHLRELPREEVFRRIALLRLRINAKKFEKGLLSNSEYSRLQHEIKQLAKETNKRLILVESPTNKYLSVDDIRDRVRLYGARFLFVDSIYLLSVKQSHSMDWKAVASISGRLANIAHDDNVTVLATTQEHERTLRQMGPFGGATISYASRIVQDADMSIHILKFIDRRRKSELYPEGEPELGLTFLTRRGSDIPDFTIRAIPAESFEFKRLKIRNPEKAQISEEKARYFDDDDAHVRTSLTVKDVRQLLQEDVN